MNTAAVIHDLLDWIDNNLESRLDIFTLTVVIIVLRESASEQ